MSRTRETRGMKRTLTVILAALLVAGCTAAGAQTPTVLQRVKLLEAKVVTLEADLATAKLRAKTAQATAERAEARYAELVDHDHELEGHPYHGLAHHDFPLSLNARQIQTVNEDDSLLLEWHTGRGSAGKTVTLTLPDIEGVTFDPPAITKGPYGRELTKFRTTATFDDVSAETIYKVVPTVSFLGIDFRMEGVVLVVQDVPDEAASEEQP